VTSGAPLGAALGARAQALGSGLPPLLVAAERIAATVAQGVHGRRRVGQGDSFWQFRPLLPGESVAHIDWRRSARAERHYFVRQTEWEAAQTVAVWAEGGPGMRWRSAASVPEKRERAALLLLALSSLLLRGGERVRLLAGARPGARPGANLGAPLGARPVDVAGHRGLARLEPSLAQAADHQGWPDPAQVPRYACVVLFSDWLTPIDTIRPIVAALAARGVTGHLLQVLDPAEVDLPYTGRVRFRAPGSPGPVATIGRTEDIRGAYADRLALQQAQLVAICHAAGLGFSVHRTDHPASAALLSLYMALAPQRSAA
jgi:uncharacterized protein (DUF58 family)